MSSTNRVLRLVCAFFVPGVFLFGCTSGLKRVPASGTVELDGKPMNGGILMFEPDATKGNTASVSCSAPIRDGKYELRTAGVERSDSGPGIPPGWYKVYARVNRTGGPPQFPGQPAFDIDARFLDPQKTPVSIEIVETPEPGAYNVTFTKGRK
jgi:hypothetical protein